MAKPLSFPAKPPHVTTETVLCLVDALLADTEERWLLARLRLPSLRGAARVKGEFLLRETEAEIAALNNRRLRIVGFEAAVSEGGKRG